MVSQGPTETQAVPGDTEIERFAGLAYAIRHRIASPRPGNHASRSPGSLGRFAGLRAMSDDADLRRLDLRASLSDPFGVLWIRQHAQDAAGTVTLLVDCSGSMGFRGSVSRHAVALSLAAGLARAVLRGGDRVAVVAGRGDEDPAPILQPTRRASAPAEIAAALAELAPSGRGCRALIEAARELPTKPGLVFLISDFQWPLEEAEALLGVLALHDVRPVVLGDPAADEPDGRFGLVHLHDLETGARAIALMRQSLVATWRRRAEAHRAELGRLFSRTGCLPVFVDGQIDVDSLFEGLVSGVGRA
ncbi:DUF58 domain-containing protein [Aurantimonas sp. 22II-16-19i]|uniref:DUF58 domain-containing protein n=1 Tax=Aurantimonas sp. 22II-16-19i TaxID=1317114 RepID=UPI0009F7E456|nr:DUF58 domain-containing protein [Aurantimonas sp. 22II-16-19i]ORE95181.1 hypothetical protein ATO4_12646 [Aurantimonas sp. 22II-16-19i]